MNCEVRKSCSLKNVVYEIGKLAAPVGVILVDSLDTRSDALFKTPRDRFLEELITVFIDVKQAYEYTLEEDIRLHVSDTSSITGPIVLELDQKHALTKGRVRLLVNRLRALGVKRVVMVCITEGEPNAKYAERLISALGYTKPNSLGTGIDLMIILDDNLEDNP